MEGEPVLGTAAREEAATGGTAEPGKDAAAGRTPGGTDLGAAHGASRTGRPVAASVACADAPAEAGPIPGAAERMGAAAATAKPSGRMRLGRLAAIAGIALASPVAAASFAAFRHGRMAAAACVLAAAAAVGSTEWAALELVPQGTNAVRAAYPFLAAQAWAADVALSAVAGAALAGAARPGKGVRARAAWCAAGAALVALANYPMESYYALTVEQEAAVASASSGLDAELRAMAGRGAAPDDAAALARRRDALAAWSRRTGESPGAASVSDWAFALNMRAVRDCTGGGEGAAEACALASRNAAPAPLPEGGRWAAVAAMLDPRRGSAGTPAERLARARAAAPG